MQQRILVIDDEVVVGLSIQRTLAAAGHAVDIYQDPQAGLQAALAGGYDVIFLDLMLPGANGLDLLARIKAADVSSEVVIITGHSTVENAVEAMKQGASDYLPKPFSPNQLRVILTKVWEHSTLIRENAALRQELELNRGFEGIIGGSRAMEQVFTLIKRVAPTDGTVLVTGESGTGKEMLVRAIHRLSRRKDAALLACDCSALAPTLLESELFGHVKGSFSGAVATKQGLFEAATKGTLFLDEVANLTMETQGKLLRVLESKRVRKVGDTAEREIDIRLIGATNRDLHELVRDGSFREDLYYRLNVVPIYLPPLRERHGDIPLLAGIFLDRFCKKLETPVKGFTQEAMARMESYGWPGNVRELRNVIERLVILEADPVIHPGHLAPEIRLGGKKTSGFRLELPVDGVALEDVERELVVQAMQRTDGNQTRAAELLGIERDALRRRLQKYRLLAG